MTAATRGLLDTSVFIAAESGRPIAGGALPDMTAISVVTLAELQAGVLVAAAPSVRARRLVTLQAVSDLAVLPIDEAVALAWAGLRVALLEASRRLNVNDTWIAATALAHGIPVVTQDDDFGAVADVSELQILKV
jgi:predicted nucleic acid-binding protein